MDREGEGQSGCYVDAVEADSGGKDCDEERASWAVEADSNRVDRERGTELVLDAVEAGSGGKDCDEEPTAGTDWVPVADSGEAEAIETELTITL